MAKGLYLHFDEIANPKKSGIRNKINGQVNAFREAGFETDVICFRSKKELFLNEERIFILPSRQLIFRYFLFRRILKTCLSNHYRFIYIRYLRSDRYFLGFLRRVKSPETKIFIEFPTFPYDSEMDPKNFVERLMTSQDRRYRTKLHESVDFAVATTKITGQIFNMATLCIDNGVELTKISMIAHRPVYNELRIIGVANLARWHAWDRVIEGLFRYYQSEQEVLVTFKIVGLGGEYEALKNLSKALQMEAYVHFRGPKMGADLDQEFETADLAMGTLGLHRIGLASTSVLKLREYTARGLPSIIGYDELSISDQEKFVLKIPADETPVNIKDLISFCQNFDIAPQEIRKYAEENFSWRKVFDPVTALLN